MSDRPCAPNAPPTSCSATTKSYCAQDDAGRDGVSQHWRGRRDVTLHGSIMAVDAPVYAKSIRCQSILSGMDHSCGSAAGIEHGASLTTRQWPREQNRCCLRNCIAGQTTACESRRTGAKLSQCSCPARNSCTEDRRKCPSRQHLW